MGGAPQVNGLPRDAKVLEEGQAVGLHIGAQLYVEHRGQVVADRAFGEARPGSPMDRDTLMLWLSAGKPVAAVAIGQLWEQGRLSLDDRVARYLPSFAVHGKETITIHHLLTHTAGFRALRLDWPRAPWDTILNRIAGTRIEPGWIPGQTAGYHPATSWFVLGELIRVIDGRSYSSYVREEVFLPLDMEHCFVGMTEADLDRLGGQVGVLHRTDRDEPIPYGYGPFASPDTFGHSGAQTSCGFADPGHDLVVCWLCNGAAGEPRHQARQFALNRAIYEDLNLDGSSSRP